MPAVSRPSTPVARHALRLTRFVLVGGCGVLVNTGVLFCLVAVLGWHQLPAAAVATEIAIISNFILNDRWTFRTPVSVPSSV